MRTPNHVRDVLIEARRLIAAGWCQGGFARCDAGGCKIDDPAATHFCIVGALRAAGYRVTRGAPNRTLAAELLVSQAMTGLEIYAVNLVLWNDRPGRTQEEVLALLDRALARQEDSHD